VNKGKKKKRRELKQKIKLSPLWQTTGSTKNKSMQLCRFHPAIMIALMHDTLPAMPMPTPTTSMMSPSMMKKNWN
jgi:hypothetical protein